MRLKKSRFGPRLMFFLSSKDLSVLKMQFVTEIYLLYSHCSYPDANGNWLKPEEIQCARKTYKQGSNGRVN